MYILFGIIGSALAVTIEFLFARYGDFTISGISYFIVFPIGAAMVGAFVGAILTKGRTLENKKVGKNQYIFALILGLATFAAINFMEYKITYLSDDYTINRVGNGTPISECSYFDDNGNEIEMTFINYEKYVLDNCDSVINGKYLKNKTIKTHGIINYIRFVIKMLGLVLACVLTVIVINKNDIYCEECRRYKKEKKLFKFSESNYDYVIQTINDSYDLKTDFNELINTKWKNNGDPVYYQAVLIYCKSCKTAEILIKEIKSKDNNEIEENRKRISINNYQAIEGLI